MVPSVAAAISAAALSAPLTAKAMLDWPLHRKTSPTSTSAIACVSPEEDRACRVKGPPAGMAGSVSVQCPSAPARARCVAAPIVTVTSAPGAASP